MRRPPESARLRLGWASMVSGTLPLLLVMAGVSCMDAPGHSEDGPILTDSSGVKIVDVSGSAWEQIRPMELDPSAVLSVGSPMGPDEAVLHRVTGAALRGDGALLILNWGSHEVRLYDRDGAPVRRWGREGEGPGEYQSPIGLWILPGDSVIVQDLDLHRITVLDPEGAVVRVVNLQGDPDANYVVGSFADGSLVHFSGGYSDTRGSGTPPELLQGSYVRLSPSGAFLDTLAEFAGRHDVAVGADGFWMRTRDSGEVLWFDRAGVIKRIVRWADAERRDEADSNERYVPGALVPRSDGGFWMQEFAIPGSGRVSRWTVFDPDGLPEGRIELASEVRTVMWASPQQVLLHEFDELGVEYVRLYSLTPLIP